MALKYSGVTMGHVPKFLSKITYFYIRNGGKLLVRITGRRRFSNDLPQGGMELPALYKFKSKNSKALLRKLLMSIKMQGNVQRRETRTRRNSFVKKKLRNFFFF